MTDEREWRKFMDQKWAEFYRDRDSFNKRYNSDFLRPYPNLLSTVADKPKVKEASKEKEATATSRDQTVPAQIKAPPKVPTQRVDYKAARRQALEARQRINLQPKKKIGTRAEPEKFNMVKAGARRRELGAKANATEAELREYKDLSNQIEAELEKKFKADEKKV